MAEEIVLFLAVVAFFGVRKLVGVGAFRVQDLDVTGWYADFLFHLAKEAFLESFHTVDAALRELPGAWVFEAFTDEDSALRILENSRDIEAKKH